MNTGLLTLLGLSLVGLCGCTSLEGAKYQYGTFGEGRKLKGVPFTLNRPVPTIVHSPGTDDKRETYTTTFNYVADSTHRYTLTVNPNYLASVDFSLTFDAMGSFAEGSSKTTDQSAAILTSVAKLAAAAFDSSANVVDLEVARLVELGNAVRFSQEELSSWGRIKAELGRLQTSKKVKAEYVYKQPDERAVLRKIFALGLGKLSADAMAYQPPKVDTTISAPPTPPAPPPKAVDLGSGIPAAVSASEYEKDVIRFKDALERAKGLKDVTLGDDIIRAMVKGNVTALNSARSVEIGDLQALRASAELKGMSPTALTSSADIINRISVLKAAADAVPGHLKLAQGMAELSPTDWKRRTVAALNTEIEAQAHTVRIQLANASRSLASTSPSSLDCPIALPGPTVEKPRAGTPKPKQTSSPVAPEQEQLCKLRQTKAIVLGVAAEYRRRAELAAELNVASTPRELKLLRDEIAALDATIADAETSLKAKPKEAKAEEPYVAFYKNVASETDEDEVKILGYVGDTRPKYVVLVRSLEVASSPGSGSGDGTGATSTGGAGAAGGTGTTSSRPAGAGTGTGAGAAGGTPSGDPQQPPATPGVPKPVNGK